MTQQQLYAMTPNELHELVKYNAGDDTDVWGYYLSREQIDLLFATALAKGDSPTYVNEYCSGVSDCGDEYPMTDDKLIRDFELCCCEYRGDNDNPVCK